MNKMLLVPFLSLLLTPTALAGGAQADRPDMSGPTPSSLELTTTVLDFPTGLRVLIQEDHAHPVVKTYMYVGHGFNDDPDGAEETAHFVEHIWFRSIHGDIGAAADDAAPQRWRLTVVPFALVRSDG